MPMPELPGTIAIPKPPEAGAIYYSPPLATGLDPSPVRPTKEYAHGGERPEIAPSVKHQTHRPFLLEVLDVPSDVFDKLHMNHAIWEVDKFILDTVTEREWVDTADVYKEVLAELRHTLNIHNNLDAYKQIEKFAIGIELLKLQKMHQRREKEIQEIIMKG